MSSSLDSNMVFSMDNVPSMIGTNNSLPKCGGSSSQPSGINQTYDFSKLNFSMFSTPVLNSSSPKSNLYDLSKMDFSKMLPSGVGGSPSLESNVKSFLPFENKKPLTDWSNVGTKIQPSSNLTIRDFPNSGFQLHIHEGETTKPSSLIDYSRKKFVLPSYDSAIADGGKPAYDAMELLIKILGKNK